MAEKDEEYQMEIDPGMSKAKGILLGLGGLLVLIAIIGTVSSFAGIGFLGHRLILYGTGELYILNLSSEERFVSVDGREPVVIHARDAQLVELIGGRSRVDILDEDHQLWRSWEIETDRSDVVLNISDEACLAVMDISSLYRDDRDQVEIVALLGADEEVYRLESRNMVWPRRQPPPRVDPSYGPALWMEIVGCPLLDEDPGFLRDYLLLRLEGHGSRE